MYAPLAYLWGALLSFSCLALINVFVDFDLVISGLFYNAKLATPWFLGDAAPWLWLYRYGEYPTLGAALWSVLLWLGSLRWRSWVRYRRVCVFLILAVALGPGLLVNGVLKPLWGRPRPRHIELFGGSSSYRPWWQPRGPSQEKSFPSGHAAMGYILVVGICLVPAQRGARLRLLIFCATLTYGTVLGCSRILQGGHFASDVICSGGLMCGTAILLYTFLPPFLLESPPDPRQSSIS